MTPICRVLSNIGDITSGVQSRLIKISIDDEIGVKSDKCTIELEDLNGSLAIPPTGTFVAPSLGFRERGLWPLGSFTVEDVKVDGWPQKMSISCVAIDMQSEIKTPKSESYESKTLQQIVGTIAGRNGLKPCVSPELASKVIPNLQQTDESDMNLLTRVAKEKGAVMKVQNGKLMIKTRGNGKTCSGSVIPTAIVTRQQITKYSGSPKIYQPRFGKVIAHWHSQGEVATKDQEASGANEADGTGSFSMRGRFASEGEATDAAAAKGKDAKRSEASASFTCEGRSDLVAGGPVLLQGVRAGIDGLWIAKSVKHNFSNSGYMIDCQLEVPTDM